MTATNPNRNSAWFLASSSDEYPMIVVSEHNVTARAVDASAPSTPAPSASGGPVAAARSAWR